MKVLHDITIGVSQVNLIEYTASSLRRKVVYEVTLFFGDRCIELFATENKQTAIRMFDITKTFITAYNNILED